MYLVVNSARETLHTRSVFLGCPCATCAGREPPPHTDTLARARACARSASALPSYPEGQKQKGLRCLHDHRAALAGGGGRVRK
jgi:hypothetical protein